MALADFIPHSRPTLGEEEAAAAGRVVASGQLAEGPEVEAFEAKAARWLGVPHAVAVSSGTAALHLALRALEIGPGDEVILPSFVCSALLNAVNCAGATPVLADIDGESLNIDPKDAARRMTAATRAVIVPHMFGLPADLEGLLSLGVPVIEDCAQAIGASLGSRRLGTYGRLAAFSFYATKVMATGEGGMVVSALPELARRVRDLKDYDRKEDYRPRFNYKLTDIQAAIGRVQLDKLDRFIVRRREIAGRYRDALRGLPVQLPPEAGEHIYFRFVAQIDTDCAAFLQRAWQQGIGCQRPVHTPLHRLLRLDGFPQTENAWRRCVSIPIYPSLTDPDLSRVMAVVSCLIQAS